MIYDEINPAQRQRIWRGVVRRLCIDEALPLFVIAFLAGVVVGLVIPKKAGV